MINEECFFGTDVDLEIGDLTPTIYKYGGNHEYSGYRFIVAMAPDSVPKRVAVVRNDEIDNAIKNIKVVKQFNYYITKNSYMNTKTWAANNLYGLNNIVIDIDCHNKNISKTERDKLIEEFCWFLTPLSEDNSKKNISKVSITGRGVQIHIKLVQASKSLGFLYDIVVEQQLRKYEEILDQFKKQFVSEFELEIDYAASKNKSAFVRLENTWNTNSKSMAQVYYSNNNEYDLNDLNIIPRAKMIKNNTKLEFKKTKELRTNLNYKYFDLENWRINYIENNYKIKKGFRNKALLIYYNSNKKILKSITEARFKLKKLNDSLDDPISQSQLEATMKYIDEGTLKFKQSTFYDWLGIKNYETSLQERERKKIIKNNLHKKIETLLENKKLSYNEISTLTDVSEITIKRHAKKNNQQRKTSKKES